MKLVDILARELKEWPEGIDWITQDGNTEKEGRIVYFKGVKPEFSSRGDQFYHPHGNAGWAHRTNIADDYSTAIVTREMWQAAKDKLEGKVKAPNANKDGWIRHRGGKCPVDKDVYISARFRSGEQFHGPAYGLFWAHRGVPSDVMAWKLHVDMVTHLPAREHKLTFTEDGPLQWRDRIHAIDAEQKAADEAHKAATDARTAERAELVQKLAGEGLALLAQEETAAPVEDMSDWANWKIGDWIEVVNYNSSSFTEGKLYKIEKLDGTPSPIEVIDDEGDLNGLWREYWKWHSRPTA